MSEERKFSNELSDAELERLAILSEELGESIQAVGKIIRHGYESYNPKEECGDSNRRNLERELGHVLYAISMLGKSDIAESEIIRSKKEKAKGIGIYLHHQDSQ